MATRKPSGLRDKIIEKTYHQCLKLLNPECHEFNRHTHNGTLAAFRTTRIRNVDSIPAAESFTTSKSAPSH